MAKSRFPSPLLLLLLLLLAAAFPRDAAAVGRKVGGRMQVKNVKDNKEVQELGRYCVGEYNRRKANEGSEKLLVFSQVVEAQTQVVSGIKYYLKVLAAKPLAGAPETFEAVVVVKPWLQSKDLIQFTPSQPPTTSTK
ncbi:cysteine proteinase inhibitor 5 [Salvia miltiorrhiza]|uniref:cysteine proteinase inhibitor 5 n=1 Tax=Salvia miltiorrhiza TaxID=226208 RepID=UPI0025AC779E|nr:cysteine proteinase inhibitor 5 [Salvia miltiorrhiza]